MRNRDIIQNWMRKNAVSLINPDVEVTIPEEGKQALKELPQHVEKVRQGAESIGHGLDETGKGLQEVGKGTQQLSVTGEKLSASGDRLAATGDKLSNTGDRAIVLGDKFVDRYDRAVSYLPWIGTGLFGGGLLGALMGGKKHTLLGSIIGATGGATAAGIAKYFYDKHRMNKQASIEAPKPSNSNERTIYLHRLAGGITNALLMTLVGAGAGAGIGHLAGRVVSTHPELSNPLISPANMPIAGAGIGALAGLGVAGATNSGGALLGLFAGRKKKREEVNKDSSIWKNYLIPGYAGYQATYDI